jgi:hypothetical protein
MPVIVLGTTSPMCAPLGFGVGVADGDAEPMGSAEAEAEALAPGVLAAGVLAIIAGGGVVPCSVVDEEQPANPRVHVPRATRAISRWRGTSSA